MDKEQGALTCSLCSYPGGDVRLHGCGCILHAKCVPLSLLAKRSASSKAAGNLGVPERDGPLKPVQPNTVLCPCCNSAPVQSIYLFPLSLSQLDKAVQLRKLEARQKKAPTRDSSSFSKNNNGKRDRDADATAGIDEHDFLEVQAESSYFLLSHTSFQSAASGLGASNASGGTSSGYDGGSSASISGVDFHRTGRWTEEETAMVDFYIEAFENGLLPIPEGVRLNDFLRDMLLCKASRLTKKMKHAKLSTRCYRANATDEALIRLDRQHMSSVEQAFLNSVQSAPARLELSFNITKLWRTMLSNLCLQVGSGPTMLLADDWMSSIEMLERRAAEADETIRTARRRRMGLALKTDSRAVTNGVFFSGFPGDSNNTGRPHQILSSGNETSAFMTTTGRFVGLSSNTALASMPKVDSEGGSNSELDFIASMLNPMPADNGHNSGHDISHESFDDFTAFFNEMTEDKHPNPVVEQEVNQVRGNCGPFLEALISLIEKQNLPFEHVDIWVPSFNSSATRPSSDEIRLYHGGFATRHDIDPLLYSQLNEYGSYSTRFSFASGAGLPGRVFETGRHAWDRHIDEADPHFFERAGGAKVYGIKTGFGMQLSTNALGRMVVAMYSTRDLVEDESLVQVCKTALAKFSPQPKWKLVVDVESAETTRIASPTSPRSPEVSKGLVHLQYNQGTSQTQHYDHGFPQNVETRVQRTGSTASFSSAACVSTSSRTSDPDYEQDTKIATLLGEHIPLQEMPPPMPQAAASQQLISPTMIPDFMSLRLLLLKSPARRSIAENEVAEIIRKSFAGYSQAAKRSPQELALLIVKDWQFLKASAAAAPAVNAPDSDKKMASSVETYTVHSMDVPTISTYAPNGAPPRMPSLYSVSAFVPSESNNPPHTQGSREVSPSGESLHSSKINIVDDSV